MATIKAIEAKSVHQIQSGQVIVDLCSVVKELVENSLDASATSIEVRFKNHGLDSIEVQDNGAGISAENYGNVALKHFTSKLSNYDDLSSLQTFGFRGEALSSLCALSNFSITTAQAQEAPKGKRLDFDGMGRLSATTLVACQKGTTATVEGLFESLPVRRKELIKNIKREYGKVLGLLHAYACICVNVKFTVKNAMPKAKSMTIFSTKANASTRENIANVYGAKTLSALAPLDLTLEFESTVARMAHNGNSSGKISVKGHISKPVFGEGRQTPDRQMFFVNGRPCGLPQIAKAINEVYKSFNVSQSPFIFADFQMNTNSYDVNVSPDKRTILLHDAATLVENLKTALNEMFEQQDQTVPQSQLQGSMLSASRRLNFERRLPPASLSPTTQEGFVTAKLVLQNEKSLGDEAETTDEEAPKALMREHFRNFTSTRDDNSADCKLRKTSQMDKERRVKDLARKLAEEQVYDEEQKDDEGATLIQSTEASQDDPVKTHVQDFNARMAEQSAKPVHEDQPASSRGEKESEILSLSQQSHPADKGIVLNAFERMRPRRQPAELATVTIGEETITTIVGSQYPRSPTGNERKGKVSTNVSSSRQEKPSPATLNFSQKLRRFDAEAGDDGEDLDSTADLMSEQGSSEQHTERETPESDDAITQPVESDDVQDGGGSESQDGTVDEDDGSDYVDEEEKQKIEEARVVELIRAAEEDSALASKENIKRAAKALFGGRTKDSTTSTLATVEFSLENIAQGLDQLVNINTMTETLRYRREHSHVAQDPEAQLSLTVAKSDFAEMDIVGQFNLGFILATRNGDDENEAGSRTRQDELFIIDQHASDEKYNFERLQAETVVGNQRLVQPVLLDLTAVEEEIVLENIDALEKNGFLVEVDMSGESVVGRRCKLISLPLSKEVVFNTRDLEELIQLLAEAPGLGTQSRHDHPRPSKVRKMFAMRACRSSIMIGKTLSKKQMETVVQHMGTIDKPWNCPHGRPTMRHVCSLNALQPWLEGDISTVENGRTVTLGDALQRFVSE
ncbi:ATP-binding mismatch repair protein [Rhinocladiella similis]